ncbi:hypothetical protein OEZ86_012178 [Tetradesmus obliquus]|nr:hypothetical protein OEZ86_012178 [Tetradesmus obliquus]
MSYLARLEPGKLSELMNTYGRDKGVRSLADQLDADPDFGVDVTNSALLFALSLILQWPSTWPAAVHHARRSGLTSRAATSPALPGTAPLAR